MADFGIGVVTPAWNVAGLPGSACFVDFGAWPVIPDPPAPEPDERGPLLVIALPDGRSVQVPM